MRFAAALAVLWALPLAAAPVPKELRTPALVGTWEIRGTNRWSIPKDIYDGDRWVFSATGGFSNPDYAGGSYALVPAGLDVRLEPGAGPRKAIFALSGDVLKVAFCQKGGERPSDFEPSQHTVIYTFRRVEE